MTLSSTAPRRSFRASGLATGVLAPVVLAGCSSSSTIGSSSESSSPAPAVAKNEALAAMLPATVTLRGTLRAAVPDGSAPLASVDDSGKAVGMDPDLAKPLGGLFGLKVEITAGSFDSQIPGLQAGRFDIAMREYYVTPARLANVDFVTDWRDYSSFATRKDDSYEPKTGWYLCGHTLGVMKGSVEEASVTELVASCTDKATVSSFPDQAASFLAMDSSGPGAPEHLSSGPVVDARELDA